MTKYSGLLVVVLHTLPILRWYRVKGDCLDPEVPKDGSRSSPNKHQFKTGEVIHYYCKANFSLVGSPKVRCLASGNWDTKAPTCLDPCGTCENGGKCVHQPGGNKYYCLCRQGYRGGKCEIPKCLPPNDVSNGGYHVYPPEGRPGYDIGSEIVFHCNEGYKISGSNADIKCVLGNGESAKWSKPFPVCKARTCRNLMNSRMIPHGKYEPNKKEYDIGDVIKFSCDAGFQIYGASSSTCSINGYWSAVNWPRCDSKRCPAPPPIAHGRVIQQSDSFPRGSTISFECMTGKGYYRFGPKLQTCSTNSNGDMVWQPPRPHCVTQSVYQHYCALQGKIFTLEPIPHCINPSQYANDGKKSITRSASIDTLTIVTGTAGGLLGFLLVIIAFVIYQRRKLMRRMRRATSRRQRLSEDERMLIYCSNDFHFVLPSYDEAINSRSTQPPSFDDAVNSGEQSQEPNDGTSSSTQERDENATITQDSTEREYETIENIQSYVSAETTDVQGSETNVVTRSDENPVADVNVRTDRAPSEDSVTDENEPLV